MSQRSLGIGYGPIHRIDLVVADLSQRPAKLLDESHGAIHRQLASAFKARRVREAACFYLNPLVVDQSRYFRAPCQRDFDCSSLIHLAVPFARAEHAIDISRSRKSSGSFVMRTFMVIGFLLCRTVSCG